MWNGTSWGPVGVGLPAYAPLNAPIFTGDARAVTPAYGDSDTSIATTAFVQSAVAPALNDAGRNLIHNPTFTVAQRGPGPWTTSGSYTVDRWKLLLNLDTSSVAQAALADADRAQIGDETAMSCLSVNVAGNAGAASFTEVIQSIEGVRRLAGKTVTLSFWAIASVAGRKLGLNGGQNFGTGGSPSAGLGFQATGNSVTLTASWARYSTTFAIPSASGKTLGTNGDDCTNIQIAFSSGATNNAAFGNIGVQSGTINLWGVQLEVGTQATPLDYGGSPQQQLAQCQRFYCIGDWASIYNWLGSGTSPASTMISFPVWMRAVPSVTFNVTSSSNASGTAAQTSGHVGFMLYTNSVSAGSVNIVASWTASADL